MRTYAGVAAVFQLTRAVALFVFFTAAAMAKLIASRRGFNAHRLHFGAYRLPEFAQVIHSPDRFAERIQPGNAGTGRAVFVEWYPRACSAL